MHKQLILDVHEKLIVDLFAGGGGMSVAFENAFGRSPDIAINHNPDALSMHQANHPETRHFVADVFEVAPLFATSGRPVGWLHLSPDCTHHSQAAGGQPRSKKIRGLAWVGYRWAGQVSPDVISLENVRQILQWGPLVAKRDKTTGHVIKLDRSVAAPGERVPLEQQHLVPDPKRVGQTWRKFVRSLEELGYVVDQRVLCAADYGGHTTRERLFMIARRDGQPTHWPEPTHFKNPTKEQTRWKPAADCLDFSLPCPSIFNRVKPLADAPLRRIARGVAKFVLKDANPFIVKYYGGKSTSEFRCTQINEPLLVQTAENRFALVTPVLTECANASNPRSMSAVEPLRTVCAQTKGGHHALIAPVLVQAAHGDGKPGRAQRWGAGVKDANAPLNTITSTGDHALAVAYLMQANGGFCTTPGHGLDEPVSTITNTGSQQQIVTVFLSHLRRNCDARDAQKPLRTISAGGEHHGVVECILSPDVVAGAERVAAFLMCYYGTDQWTRPADPLATITTKDRMALVMVNIKGTPYHIVDIGMRMLQPRELFSAQDFPSDYIINRGHDGRIFSKTTQVRMAGNSVNPVMAIGFLQANAPWLAVHKAA
jgi:DNA (cytosine-5)-methyltransferase 1